MMYDAESQVIGGLAVFPAECGFALDTLGKDDFRDERLGDIFAVMQAHRDRDLPAVIAMLDKENAKTLTLCAESLLSLAGYQECVEIVRDAGQRRRIQSELMGLVMEPEGDILGRLDKLVATERQHIANQDIEQRRRQSLLDYGRMLYEPMEPRFQIGIGSLDRMIGGLMRGTISYIGAGPSTGKTSFALGVMARQQGVKRVLFSLEMTQYQIYDRLVTIGTGIPYDAVFNRAMTEKQEGVAAEYIGKLYEDKGLIVVDDAYTIEGISGMIAKIKPDLVMVDFMQCVRSMRRFPTRRDTVDYISQEFKRLAKTYDCHIMILSQLARSTDNKPSMSSLKESGGLEQDGDYIMLLYRPYVHDKTAPPEVAYVLVDKNKYGRTGQTELYFDGAHQRFTDMEARY